ncbi:MAG: hypothetical protein ACTSRP_15495 [Candidatus Helarchaeota archaeon]
MSDYKVDSKENSDYMYNIIAQILTEIGPRGSCTPEEHKGAQFFSKELEKFCDEVKVDMFETYPQLSIISWIPRSVYFILLSVLLFTIFYQINVMIISLICVCILFFNLFLVYKQYLKIELWKKESGSGRTYR